MILCVKLLPLYVHICIMLCLERDSLIAALGCTSDPALINKYLELSIDPTSVIRLIDIIIYYYEL